MQQINTIIFDWDGTLHETATLYGASVRYAIDFLTQKGFTPDKPQTDEYLSKYLGMTAAQMWVDYYPMLPPDLQKQAEKIVGQKMDSQIMEGKATLYKGCEEMLNELKNKGYTLAILSNARHDYLEAHRSYFGLDKWFSSYYAAEDYDFIPKEEIFETIKDELPDDYIIVGDRDSDLKTALKHDLKSIGCLYGYGSPKELSPATALAENISDIPKLISQFQKRRCSGLR